MKEGVIELTVASREQGSWAIVDVAGEVDVFTAPKLREEIATLVARGHHKIVINLEEVEFMDSTGLGVLVSGLKRVKEHEGILALASPGAPVMRVLSITGLNQVFPVHDSVDEATAG